MKTKTQSQNLLINGYHSESSSSSPPASPRPSEKLLHCRRRLRKKVQPARSPRESVISFLVRRYLRLLLLAPLLYISGMLVCVGTVSIVGPRSLPGSVYRSGETFQKLWPAMQMDNETTIELCSIWKYGRRRREHWKPCANHTLEYSGLPAPSGYLIIEANGGLNQQRSSICNAVAIAGLLNAILVIPQFHFHTIWKDRSIFSDIYDEDHFIETLKGHVRVVRELPQAVVERFDNNISNIPNLRIKAWAPVNYYMGAVFPTLREQGVIRISPFANRLAFEVPSNVQTLRCLANYQALRFSVPIATLAKNLVDRMIEKSLRTDGKYVSVHLRFEEDMVAFSCCVYDGGKAERIEMASERERGWKGKFNREGRIIRPDINRMNGKCPLTPLEVGMMLRGMGFNNNTAIYLASGEIYQAEKNLAPLLQMFPLLETKETLATQEELSSFVGFSSRLAALDYTVCLFSEVFVTTQGGNFPHFLMGHRRYLYNGHAKTVKPDKQKLAVLLEDLNTSWGTFKREMREMLKESVREGFSLRKKHASIYTFPTPDCMCYSKESLDQRLSPLLPIPPANEKLTLSYM